MTTYFSMCNIEVTDDSEAPECDECYVITLCKHRVRGLTKPQVTSILRLSSRMLSCLYTSLRPIGQSFLSYCIIHRGHDLALIWLRILTWCREMFWFGCQQHTCLHCMLSIILLLYVSNLWRIFSKCTFWQHSSYFQFSFHTLPSFCRKQFAFRKTPLRVRNDGQLVTRFYGDELTV